MDEDLVPQMPPSSKPPNLGFGNEDAASGDVFPTSTGRAEYVRTPKSLVDPRQLQQSFRTHEVLLAKIQRQQEEAMELRLAYEASLEREQRLLALNHKLQRLADDRGVREERALTAARSAQIELEEERAKVRGLVQQAGDMQRKLDEVLTAKSWCEGRRSAR